MFRLAIRFIKTLVILSLIAVVSVAAGLAFYAVQGGSLSKLGGWQSLGQLKEPAALSDLREVIEKYTPAIAGLLKTAPPAQEKPEPPQAPEAKPVEEPKDRGAIRVYFAPCQPATLFGIDEAFISLIEHAQRSIHGAFFELELPAAADALIARHKAGVEVRLVSDSDYKGRAAVQSCIAAGIPVVFDERNAFMHDKFCIVDGAQVWTGSTNITENCMYRNDNNSLLISSPTLAQDYEAEFDEMFREHLFGKKSPRNTPYPRVAVGDIEVECYFAPEDEVEPVIVKDIDAAKTEIDVMAFSFTSKPLANAIASRIAGGVKVRVLLDERQAGSDAAQGRYLLDKGAAVELDRNPYAMHNKVIIIDDGIVITGSYNLSKSANTENDENVLIIHSPSIAAQYKKKFESIFSAN